MNKKRLSALLAACNTMKRADNSSLDPEVSSLVYDSRDVGPGSMFFAIPGAHTDGHRFIATALEKGAAAVVFQTKDEFVSRLIQDGIPDDFPRDIQLPHPVFIAAESSRQALSRCSAAFHDYPHRDLTVIGITGTDGKSSTVAFLHQLLNDLGIPAGFISTVAMQTGTETRNNMLRQSTPEAPDIHRLLAEMRANGKQAAVVESTSHGLSRKTSRLLDLEYDGAIFTNISHEHLEFHGSFPQYLSDKTNLFRQLKDSQPDASNTSVAVINLEDPNFSYIARAAAERSARICAFISSQSGDWPRTEARKDLDLADILFAAHPVEHLSDGNRFSLRVVEKSAWSGQPAGKSLKQLIDQTEALEMHLPIPGGFNIDNVLGCTALLSELLSVPVREIAGAAAGLKGVKGRMVPLFHGQPFTAIVDYAHTPGSFTKVFPLFRESCRGRLIAVFGSAGERDTAKRPIQGAIAAEYADILVITDEDPRLEDSMDIIRDISRGARESGHAVEIHEIADRRSAISAAFSMAGEGDTVVMLGKGHEGSIITAAGKQAWDEESVARDCLEQMGYTRQK
ncbi:Mur ligase family protein [Salinispira pacifica]|nr:UDP-N-acetylmuramyl-tripeptide synthetase [Salinispira pacifica]